MFDGTINNHYQTLFDAYAAYQEPNNLRKIKVWVPQAVDLAFHPHMHTKRGWDRAVFHQHDPETVEKVVDGFFNQLTAAGFKDTVDVQDRVFDSTGPIVTRSFDLTLRKAIRWINNEHRASGNEQHIIKLTPNVGGWNGWALGLNLIENELSPGGEYRFIALARQNDIHNLGKIKIFTGVKGRANDTVYDIGVTTLAEVIRKPNPLEWVRPQMRAAFAIRSVLPAFRDSAANIIVPEYIRVEACRNQQRNAIDSTLRHADAHPVGAD